LKSIPTGFEVEGCFSGCQELLPGNVSFGGGPWNSHLEDSTKQKQVTNVAATAIAVIAVIAVMTVIAVVIAAKWSAVQLGGASGRRKFARRGKPLRHKEGNPRTAGNELMTNRPLGAASRRPVDHEASPAMISFS
jgi:hypothetical protein